ncbi:MAG TPA: prefoldin subunit alpha [Candidatus Nanoarchaeia archaeon]|nr:prefoldin subunit alpha [Candidatus Nanoarchaeia archaeon]
MAKNPESEKMVEFQMLQQQLELMQKYSEELDEKIVEFSKTKTSLEEISTIKSDADLLVPIAQGIFAQVKAADIHHLIVNVGANTMVTKKIPQVTALIEKQIDEVTSIKQKIEENTEKLAERLNGMLEEMQAQ